MSDNATSTFQKMGENPLTGPGCLVNVSGDRSANTIPVARKGPSGDSESEPAGHRGAITMDGEHNGPRFRPVATLPARPDPKTGRGMRTVASAVGNRDFWNDGQASQSGEVIS